MPSCKVAIPEGEHLRSVVGWGNYYTKSRYTFHKFHHIPHIDGPGWVGNLWLSDHEEGSRGTQFYNYKDEWKEDLSEFKKIREKYLLYK